MSILSPEERTAIQALPRARLRSKRAEALVNPASGLANDYLNLFNEIVMLVEQLPTMPELFEDICRWRPASYRDYFLASVLPGRLSAIDSYNRLDPSFRQQFEALVEELDRRATGAVAVVRRQFRHLGEADSAALASICEKAGATIREVLDRATMLVNHGTIVAGDPVQQRTDSVLANAGAVAR